MPFTNANGPVHLLASQGTFARFSTEKPTMTFFRYNAQQCTSFGQCWFFENFDKGASAYLGESLTYTASRNKDIHGDTLIAVDLPGIGNFQWDTTHLRPLLKLWMTLARNTTQGSLHSESIMTATDNANFLRKGRVSLTTVTVFQWP